MSPDSPSCGDTTSPFSRWIRAKAAINRIHAQEQDKPPCIDGGEAEKVIMAQQAVCDVIAKIRSVLVAKKHLRLFDGSAHQIGADFSCVLQHGAHLDDGLDAVLVAPGHFKSCRGKEVPGVNSPVEEVRIERATG